MRACLIYLFLLLDDFVVSFQLPQNNCAPSHQLPFFGEEIGVPFIYTANFERVVQTQF